LVFDGTPPEDTDAGAPSLGGYRRFLGEDGRTQFREDGVAVAEFGWDHQR